MKIEDLEKLREKLVEGWPGLDELLGKKELRNLWRKNFRTQYSLEAASVELLIQSNVAPGLIAIIKAQKRGSVLSTVGIGCFDKIAQNKPCHIVWLSKVTPDEIIARLDAMGVVGIVDTAMLHSWTKGISDSSVPFQMDLPVNLPSQITFKENHVYYVVQSLSNDWNRELTYGLSSWRDHVQRGSEINRLKAYPGWKAVHPVN